MPEHGMSPWHQPPAAAQAGLLTQHLQQRQELHQERQEQGAALHQVFDPDLGMEGPAGPGSDSLSELDAQV